MTPPRPLWKSVQDYVLIAIGMISYAIGWNVFLLPTCANSVFYRQRHLINMCVQDFGSKVLCQDSLCRYSGNHPDLFLLQPFR